KRHHLGHLPAHLLCVAPGPANFDLRVAADGPTHLLQSLQEGGEPRLSLRIVGRKIHEHADASHSARRLLRARCERPRPLRAAAAPPKSATNCRRPMPDMGGPSLRDCRILSLPPTPWQVLGVGLNRSESYRSPNSLRNSPRSVPTEFSGDTFGVGFMQRSCRQ